MAYFVPVTELEIQLILLPPKNNPARVGRQRSPVMFLALIIPVPLAMAEKKKKQNKTKPRLIYASLCI